MDDLPREPLGDEPVFEITLASLDLTEHQQLMLASPEDRIAELQFPKSIKDRATRKRKHRHKDKLSRKLQG